MRGILFDFNGTIFYDSDLHEIAWKRFLKETFNYDITLETVKNEIHGVSNVEVIKKYIGNDFTQEELLQYSLQKESMYRKILNEKPERKKFVDGACETLDCLKEKNIPMTIATASEISNVTFFIETFHLEKWFDLDKIVYDNGNLRGKPHPDLYLAAAKQLGMNPKDCIVLEDAFSGIEAAKRANVGKILAIAATSPKEKLEKIEGIDGVITKFNEILNYI